MILHIDPEGMSLISLPRDLFYRGKKINDIYRTFGPEQMMADLSEITGLDIEKYVVIDMYAFIDAVDIIGGVDITLPEDLIDPTMKIRDNGKWSTLYYPAGDYHFSGLEALRVTRSRHYSSDFGRTERQQQILTGILEKIQSFNITDTGRIYELVLAMLEYVDTNLNAFEIVELLFRHRNSSLGSKTVLNTQNVLYHTYSNLYYLGKKAEDVDDSFNRGAWILLPAGNDWNVIRWFIRGIVEGVDYGRSGTKEGSG